MQLKAKLLSILILSTPVLTLFSSVSCSKSEPDYQTLHFTTKDDIKTTLDIDLEMYRADDRANLYYSNFRYYSRTKTGQWAISSSPDGPWKTFPDQAMVPKGLQLLPH